MTGSDSSCRAAVSGVWVRGSPWCTPCSPRTSGDCSTPIRRWRFRAMGQRDRHAHWPIGDVLDRTDLAALLDELTEASGRLGPGRKWHCPIADHDDHHASVTMFRDRHGHERWRCWSADHRGDTIDLVAGVRRCDRLEAVDWLATRAGLIPDRPLPPIRSERTQPVAAAVEPSPLVERGAGLRKRISWAARARGARLAPRSRSEQRDHRSEQAWCRPRAAT